MRFHGIPKVAAPKSEQEEDRAQRAQRIRKAVGAGPAFLGGAVAAGGSRLLLPMLANLPAELYHQLRSGKEIPAAAAGKPIEDIAEFSSHELQAIRDFARAEKVNVPIVAGATSAYHHDDVLTGSARKLLNALGIDAGPAVDPHIILDSTSVPVAFHEISHAAEPPLAGVWRLLLASGRGLPGDVARGALMGNAMLPPDEDTGKSRRFAYDHAPALMALTKAPELLEEARASLRGMKGFRAGGGSAMAFLKEMGPAFASHVGVAASPIIATALAQRLVKYLYEQAGEEKKAASGMPPEPKMSGALKAPASAAWHMGAYPKPKTTTPNQPARSQPTAKPPSNRSFHADMAKSLADPSRGVRNSLTG